MENTCKKCGDTKDISLFSYSKKHKLKISNECKSCESKRTYDWRNENKEKCKTNRNNWKKNNPDKIKLSNSISNKKNKESIYLKNKKWKDLNIEKVREQSRIKNNNNTKNINDCYVKNIILKPKGFTKEQITPELIEVQRIIIKTKRLCKTSQI